ncbi:MAG TPA: hypothetical protein VGX25_16585 [Actinophytocola sp.]|uniref:hypothetical protein n=1 Tax=Actinophytocola sp. TaxID=1872138 RepID=UPI002DDCF3CC|nr:hypothetical protein [Actinophytocola sp.]HEV2781002.1 hypothetical protein [Actinophytocola sp.]
MAAPATVSVPDLVLYAVAVVLPVAAFWAVLAVPRLVEGFKRRFRRPEMIAHGPPIEQLAADLRRVHRVLEHLAPGTTIVRWRATRHAYDSLLTQACAAVEVEHRLDELPEGFERNMERLRIEEALRAAGLAIP